MANSSYSDPAEPFSLSRIRSAEVTYMQRVYQWMSLGLALTGFVALWTAGNPALLRMIAGSGFWILFLAQIGIVIWLSATIMRIPPAAAVTGFLVYSALNGLTLSFIFLLYTGASIASTFFVTAGTFAAVSLFGWVTKSDLSSMGSFLFMGLIGIILGSVVNIFLKSPAVYWIITYAGIAVFIGLTAYDTQKLKNLFQRQGGGTEQLAILGALTLYLDFINMFLFLIRIFGRRR